MVIGVQTSNRLTLPGSGEQPSASGRSRSDSTSGSLPEPEPVEIPSSTAAAGPSAIVELNASGAGALFQALLAGDRASPAPTYPSQVIPVPSTIQPDGLTAAAAEALQSQISNFRSQISNPSESASLLNESFIEATRELAGSLLASAAPPLARVVPLEPPPQTEDSATGLAKESDPLLDKLSRMVELLMDATDGLTEKGKSQLKRLTRFTRELQEALGERSPSAQPAPQAARLAQTGFTFEIEVRRSVAIDATVTSLNETGIQAVRIQAASESVTRLRVTVGGSSPQTRRADPVVLDLDRDGQISLDDLAAGEGQRFDINGDGAEELTSLVSGGDALLALDRNGNGLIDDGGELFGDQRGAANGMEELARLDGDGDGRLTRRDPLFGQLQAFLDLDGDGRLGKSEFRPLSQFGVSALSLNYVSIATERADGNALSAESAVEFDDGSSARMVDAELTYTP